MKLLLLLSLLIGSSQAALVGKKAPSFKLKNHKGELVSLSEFKGKTVVLEWLNHGCPFVKKHYNSNNMQKTQKAVIDKDTVWLSIISSAEGKQGYSTVEQAASNKNKFNSNASFVLLDSSGTVGRKYEAKTTPHMFVVNKEGIVVYEGAIDSIASADPSDIKEAKNYILQAIKEVKKGKKISKAKTTPYGCSVKY